MFSFDELHLVKLADRCMGMGLQATGWDHFSAVWPSVVWGASYYTMMRPSLNECWALFGNVPVLTFCTTVLISQHLVRYYSFCNVGWLCESVDRLDEASASHKSRRRSQRSCDSRLKQSSALVYSVMVEDKQVLFHRFIAMIGKWRHITVKTSILFSVTRITSLCMISYYALWFIGNIICCLYTQLPV